MSAHNIPSAVLTKKIKLYYPKSAAMGLFSYGLKNNEFETAVVNEPSVFEPLKFYCICNEGLVQPTRSVEMPTYRLKLKRQEFLSFKQS